MSNILNKGSFVRFSAKDENGDNFSFVGQVVNVDKKANKVFLDADAPYHSCAMELDLSKYTAARKPKNWKKPEATVVVKSSTKKVTTSDNVKMPVAGSKAERVLELVRSNSELSRKDHISMVVETIGMTPAGASTYVSNARKIVSVGA